MNKKYVLIGVEGNHDQAFIAKILCKLFKFSEFTGEESKLDSFWRKFIPTYPKGENLYKRMDMPTILYNENFSIALYVGEGTKLIEKLKLKLSNIDYENDLFAFAVIADADKKTPDQVAEEYYHGLKEDLPKFPNKVNSTGNFIEGSPKLGIYILPDNIQQGVLENLICDCGDLVYPEYMQRAREYIDKFSEENRKQKDLKWKPFDREKL